MLLSFPDLPTHFLPTCVKVRESGLPCTTIHSNEGSLQRTLCHLASLCSVFKDSLSLIPLYPDCMRNPYQKGRQYDWHME